MTVDLVLTSSALATAIVSLGNDRRATMEAIEEVKKRYGNLPDKGEALIAVHQKWIDQINEALTQLNKPIKY